MKRFLLVVVLGILLIPGCGDVSEKKEIIYIVHAGSLSIPFKEMAAEFEKKFPGIEVKLEAHGSRTCARQIIDLHRRFDVMGSADSDVIKNLLMPEYVDYCISFATNEMVIMYNDRSLYSEKINSNNWYSVLLKPDVQYGHSDPNSDPCGYRALLTWKLAEKHYEFPGLYERLRKKMPKKNMRSKEVDLIALLEANEVDYIFIYRSVAEQHGSKYTLLPDRINLKSEYYSEFYKSVSLNIAGKKQGEWIKKTGTPMVYGITVPNNAISPGWGIKFVEFVLGREGRDIMRKNGQPDIFPPVVDNYQKLPGVLKKFFNEI